MYCSIHEAWDNKNSLSNLSKRYQENFNPSLNDELSSYKINKNDLPNSSSQKKPKLMERQDARYNNDDTTVFDNDIIDTQSEDIQTEDIILSSIEPEEVKPIKPVYKNKKLECEQLVRKVLSCPTCRKMLEKKLNVDKNPLQNLVNNEMREIMILILIGLVIMIIIDLFIRISK
jgi:hypothetical protein